MFENLVYKYSTTGSSTAAAAAFLSVMGCDAGAPARSIETPRVVRDAYIVNFSHPSSSLHEVKAIDSLHVSAIRALDRFSNYFSENLADTPADFGKAISDNFMDLL